MTNQTQATVETVVKVSGNRKVDKTATESANATQTATDTITGTLKEAADGGNATSKPKPKIDTTVEKEVDRIIDSQDNEYVLSKPKCVCLSAIAHCFSSPLYFASPREQGMGLTLDPQLIRDLTVLIASSSVRTSALTA